MQLQNIELRSMVGVMRRKNSASYREELLKKVREIQNRKDCLVRLMSFLSLEFSYQGCMFICQEFVRGFFIAGKVGENDLYDSF